MPDALEQRQNILVELEFEQRIMPGDHFRFAAAIEQDLRSGLGRLAGTDMRQNAAIADYPFDKDFQLAAGSFLTEKARWDHPGIVEHHQIARPHMVQQIGEVAMRELSRFAFEHQQTTGAPLRQGMSCDQGIGQLEEKIGNLHGSEVGTRKGRKSYPKHVDLTTPSD